MEDLEVTYALHLSLQLVGKPEYDFLFVIIELLRQLLPLRRYKAKRVKTHCSWRGTWVSLSQDFREKGSSLGNIFWFLQNQTHFAIWQCKLHCATCSRFDTIPACDRRTERRTDGRTDRQTDGDAIALTALAMRALRRAVNYRHTLAVTFPIRQYVLQFITFFSKYETQKQLK